MLCIYIYIYLSASVRTNLKFDEDKNLFSLIFRQKQLFSLSVLFSVEIRPKNTYIGNSFSYLPTKKYFRTLKRKNIFLVHLSRTFIC